ncbi:starch synthase [Halopseudomonas sabulinigri]|uniref:Glycogen synthase n=1 Tax=Halopseudomonas sabulinigri TaxID=472181 RepID=A0A1H1PBS0_9GAMM|nr:glycogen synthase GlgA [Halopseudomonas sabulinigri]SDS08475.1 starch synthase [Halopseudomonas sabulinigri]
MGQALNTSLTEIAHSERIETPKISFRNHQKVLFVTSELNDLIKVGGLGDVAAALPRALNAYHDMRVLIPGYKQVLESGYPIRVVARLEGHAALPRCHLGRIDLPDGLIVYVVLNEALYNRSGTPYGDIEGRDWPDNHIRFARFALAAAQLAAGEAKLAWEPELVHANDWPSGLAPAYMKWMGLDKTSVFTIHNLAYQGLCDPRCLSEFGLPSEFGSAQGMEYYGKLSLLKAGINYADHITTVSQTYAHEITTPEFGCGLEGLLAFKARQGLLTGIANGIDEDFNPTNDAHLLGHFDSHRWEGRAENTRYVEQYFALQQDESPLFSVVSRLVHQKGIDLTIEVTDHLVKQGGRLAVLGRGERHLEERMKELEARYPGRVGVHIDFTETLARRMFAGSDFLLMPSVYEPCGLSQMYAQCFGSLPVARRTGGLADTIVDGVTGILFDKLDPQEYMHALDRSFAIHRNPPLMRAMRCKAMATPNYWQQAVRPYASLYGSLVDQQTHLSKAHTLSMVQACLG